MLNGLERGIVRHFRRSSARVLPIAVVIVLVWVGALALPATLISADTV